MEKGSRIKKIVVIIAIILVIAGISLFLLLLFLPKAPTTREPTSFFDRLPLIGRRAGPQIPTGAPSAIPQPASEETADAERRRRLIQITNEPVIGPAVSEDSRRILYFRKRDGHLVNNSFIGGNEQTTSNLTILNILDVAWSPLRNRAVVTYQDGEILKKFITEATSTPKVAFLPQEAQSPVWSPDGNSIFWMTRQNQTYTLTSASRDGQNPKSRGFTTPIPDLQPLITTPDTAALIPKTASIFETPLFLLNLKNLAQNTALFAFGLTAITDENPKTQLISYAATNRLGVLEDLHTFNVQSGQDTSWPVKTLPEKCVFSKEATELFCAVPKEVPARSLPEIWYKGQTSFSDSFFRFDLKTNKAEQILGESGQDAVSLAVSPDNKYLFFLDKKTSFLYSLLLE